MLTQTSAPGNKAPWGADRCPPLGGGFTLLELLVVLVIVSVASAGLAWAVRSGEQRRLQEEAERLAALLQTARSQSRVSGQPIRWRALSDSFEWADASAKRTSSALPAPDLPTRWLHEPAPQVYNPQGSRTELLLGPEPLLAAQSVVLAYPGDAASGRARLAYEVRTDGLSAFEAKPAP